MKSSGCTLVFLALLAACAVAPCGPAAEAPAGAVTAIRALCRDGQTFITWRDAAEGDEAVRFRYNVYRSDKPIGPELAGAERCVTGVLYNSGKLFGTAFNQKDRLDPARPMTIVEEKGQPLPPWSGLAVVTVAQDGQRYYAVVATDAEGNELSRPEPGKSATTEPVAERVAAIQPILFEDSLSRKGPYIKQTCITGKQGLPLWVELHASSGGGGGAGEYGDYYLYFARREWGWMDGLPGVFAVQERRDGWERLVLGSRDAIVTPDARPMETFWFGYVCVPQWASHKEPRAYNFTERRMLWVVDWCVRKYGADPERVYAGGGSMGAWGSSTFAFRHPELFAAVYPNRPRTRQRGMPSLAKNAAARGPVLMEDGETPYLERMDMVKFAAEHHEDLPPYIWCCGRRDGFATWQEQVDMVKSLTASHHGFAFAWNNGNHSSGSAPMGRVMKYYGPGKFARNRSYPAFGNSSLDDNLGTGDPADGDLGNDDPKQGPTQVFGINLGFAWSDVVDEEQRWSATLSNDLCQAEMTVDVTPRRCQRFKPRPGQTFTWTNNAGGAGTVTADQWGLVTVAKVAIKPGAAATLAIRRD